MPDRTKIVSTMLTTARQIVASDEFARDAIVYANMAHELEDNGAAKALRSMAMKRKVEAMVLRACMSELAADLARMPIEAD